MLRAVQHRQLAESVEFYTQLGNDELVKNDLEKARLAFDAALKFSVQTSDDAVQRSCALNLGAIYIALGRYDEGLQLLQNAMPPNKSASDKDNGDLHYNFGLAYEGLQNASLAIHFYHLALLEYKKETNFSAEAEVSCRLAEIYSDQNMHEVSANMYEQASLALGELGNSDRQAYMLLRQAQQQLMCSIPNSNDGEASLDAVRYILERCLNLIKSSLSQLPERSENKSTAKLLLELGQLFLETNLLEKANGCVVQCLTLCAKDSNLIRLLPHAHSTLGRIYAQLRHYKESLKQLDTAIHLFERTKETRYIAQVYLYKGFVLSNLNRYAEALESFSNASNFARQTGNAEVQWQALENSGVIAFLEGNDAESIRYFQQALVITGNTGNDRSVKERIVNKLSSAVKRDMNVPYSSTSSTTKHRRSETGLSHHSDFNDVSSLNGSQNNSGISFNPPTSRPDFLSFRLSETPEIQTTPEIHQQPHHNRTNASTASAQKPESQQSSSNYSPRQFALPSHREAWSPSSGSEIFESQPTVMFSPKQFQPHQQQQQGIPHPQGIPQIHQQGNFYFEQQQGNPKFHQQADSQLRQQGVYHFQHQLQEQDQGNSQYRNQQGNPQFRHQQGNSHFHQQQQQQGNSHHDLSVKHYRSESALANSNFQRNSSVRGMNPNFPSRPFEYQNQAVSTSALSGRPDRTQLSYIPPPPLQPKQQGLPVASKQLSVVNGDLVARHLPSVQVIAALMTPDQFDLYQKWLVRESVQSAQAPKTKKPQSAGKHSDRPPPSSVWSDHTADTTDSENIACFTFPHKNDSSDASDSESESDRADNQSPLPVDTGRAELSAREEFDSDEEVCTDRSDSDVTDHDETASDSASDDIPSQSHPRMVNKREEDPTPKVPSKRPVLNKATQKVDAPIYHGHNETGNLNLTELKPSSGNESDDESDGNENDFEDEMSRNGPEHIEPTVVKDKTGDHYVTAKFPFVAEQPDELSLNPGDRVKIISFKPSQDQGWWQGELNGVVGLFPFNFVELSNEGASHSLCESDTEECSHSECEDSADDAENDALNHENEPSNNDFPIEKPINWPTIIKETADIVGNTCSMNEADIARIHHNETLIDSVKQPLLTSHNEPSIDSTSQRSLTSRTETSIDSVSQQLVTLHNEKTIESAATSHNEKTIDSAVTSHNEIIDSSHQPLLTPHNEGIIASVTQQPVRANNETIIDSVEPVNEPIIKPVKAAKAACNSGELDSPCTLSVSGPSNAQIEVTEKPLHTRKYDIQQCKALYDFDGEERDELNFKAGELITLLDANTGEKDWWRGVLNGRVGLFPVNFVQLLEPRIHQPEQSTMPDTESSTLPNEKGESQLITAATTDQPNADGNNDDVHVGETQTTITTRLADLPRTEREQILAAYHAQLENAKRSSERASSPGTSAQQNKDSKYCLIS